jgi:Domain of unknown function (DUF834).
MVAAGDHRRGGAAAERGEGRGKRKGRSSAHPGATATTGTVTGAEEGGGAARVDEDGGAPAVGGRNGGGRHRERLNRAGAREGGRGRKETGAAISGSIDAPAKFAGAISDESEGEREGKEGGKREGITGSDFPLFMARGDGGMRRIRRRRRR